MTTHSGHPARTWSWPTQLGLAALGGGLASMFTSIQTILWANASTDVASETLTYALSFAPVVVAFTAFLGVMVGLLVFGSSVLVQRGVLGSTRSPRASAAIGAATMFTLGLIITVWVGIAGCGFAIWPLALVTVGGAVHVYRRPMRAHQSTTGATGTE